MNRPGQKRIEFDRAGNVVTSFVTLLLKQALVPQPGTGDSRPFKENASRHSRIGIVAILGGTKSELATSPSAP